MLMGACTLSAQTAACAECAHTFQASIRASIIVASSAHRSSAHQHPLRGLQARGGTTKKKGSGGKFTWGSMLADAGTPRKLDRNDPMYDSEEDAVLRTASDGDSGVASDDEASPSRIVQLVTKLKADVRLLISPAVAAVLGGLGIGMTLSARCQPIIGICSWRAVLCRHSALPRHRCTASACLYHRSAARHRFTMRLP